MIHDLFSKPVKTGIYNGFVIKSQFFNTFYRVPVKVIIVQSQLLMLGIYQ